MITDIKGNSFRLDGYFIDLVAMRFHVQTQGLTSHDRTNFLVVLDAIAKNIHLFEYDEQGLSDLRSVFNRIKNKTGYDWRNYS